MTNSNKKSGLLLVAAFASIYIIWGSTFLAVSYGLQSFPPFLLSGLRFLIAGIILFIWQKSKGEKVSNLQNWKRNGITGILILIGGTGLVAWGEQYISSTEAAIAIATGPFWFIALDRKNWSNYFSDKTIVTGLIIGFSGLLVFLKGSVSGATISTDGLSRIIAFIVLAISSISWVLGSLYSKNNPGSQSRLMNISQQLLIAGIVSTLFSGAKGEWYQFSFSEVNLYAWLGLGFLIFFGSIVAYISYIWLLTVKEPVLVSTHTYINPIVAVLVGWIIAGEKISSLQFLGLIVILSGVVLTNLSNIKINKRTKVKIRKWNQTFIRISNPYKHITQ